MPETMQGAFLPGNSTTQLRDVPVPTPGHGEVLSRMKASMAPTSPAKDRKAEFCP